MKTPEIEARVIFHIATGDSESGQSIGSVNVVTGLRELLLRFRSDFSQTRKGRQSLA